VFRVECLGFRVEGVGFHQEARAAAPHAVDREVEAPGRETWFIV